MSYEDDLVEYARWWANPPKGDLPKLHEHAAVREALARMDQAMAAVGRVRDLHYATEPGEWICEACAEPWPCPTIQALDGTP